MTHQNVQALLAWQQAEGGSASFNPLNTTQGYTGASDYNSVHVRNYPSASAGLAATKQTLLNGHYGNIINDLRSGKASARQIATDVANSPWGTGGGVLRVLGAGPVKTPSYGSGSAAPTMQGPQPTSIQNQLAAAMLQQSSMTAAGQNQGGELLAMAMARKQAGAAQDVYGAQPSPGGKPLTPAAPTPTKGLLPFLGNYGSEAPSFIQHLSVAAAAAGATKIRVNSGERSPQHNSAVGGASHSNHLPDAQGYGHALDGDGFVPGRGWVPLGTLLAGSAQKYGLRSGASFNWNGAPDVVHVDDGYNQR